MALKQIPQGATFAFDIARGALDKQLSRIDSIDTKAGVLLAADGILAGLIVARGSVLETAPWWIAVPAIISILLSFGATLRALAGRSYEIAPTPEEVARLSGASERWIRWNLIGNVLEAVEINRMTLRTKARWLGIGQFLLLVALFPVGAYSSYASISGGA